MIVLGLTGSIGMGKSTAAKFLRGLGVPVHDADAAVHRLYAPGGAAVAPLQAAFPAAVRDGAVDRAALSRILAADPGALRRLEEIVHPLARREQEKFLRVMAMRRLPIVILDIPLLFETGGERRCDAVMVVSAPAFLQRQRVLPRPGMDAAKFDLIMARQMPDAEKRRRAEFVIPSNQNMREMLGALKKALAELKRPRAGKRRSRHARNRA